MGGAGGMLRRRPVGPLLNLPNSVSDASPFNHVPQVPAAAVWPGPLLALTLIAAAFAVVGLSGLRRRDIGWAAAPVTP